MLLIPARYRSPQTLRIAWILLLSLVALGVFWLPYHVPFTPAAASESAAVGFNNRVALLVILAGVALATMLSLLSSPDEARPTHDEAQLGVRPLAAACVLQSIVILVMNWIVQGGPPSG